MRNDHEDYTALFKPQAVDLAGLAATNYSTELFEYSRASEVVLCAIMNALTRSGATFEEGKAFMQTRALRKMFDGGLEQALYEAAFKHAEQIAKAELAAWADDIAEIAADKPRRKFKRDGVGGVFEDDSNPVDNGFTVNEPRTRLPATRKPTGGMTL